MAKEFLLTGVDDLHGVSGWVNDHFEDGGKLLKMTITESGKRSLSQNAFQHVCYQEISKFLISNGRKDCNPDWVKEMLKNSFLGWTQESFTDVVTGKVMQRDVLRKTSALDKGEALEYTQNLLDWALNIGLMIKVPEKSDHMKHMRE